MAIETQTVELDQALLAQVDELAAIAGRSRVWLIEEALRHFIEVEGPDLRSTRAALDEVLEDERLGIDRGIPHDEVMARLRDRRRAGTASQA